MKKLRKQKYGHFFTICMKTETAVLIVSGIEEKKLSEYCNPEWVEWVSKVIEGEIYNEAGINNDRAYTNVKAVYDNIKLDFYHNLNN